MEQKELEYGNAKDYNPNGNESFWKVKQRSNHFADLRGWKPWRNTIVTTRRFPSIDVNNELRNDTSSVKHARNQDGKAKCYFQFSFIHNLICFLTDVPQWPAPQFSG